MMSVQYVVEVKLVFFCEKMHYYSKFDDLNKAANHLPANISLHFITLYHR